MTPCRPGLTLPRFGPAVPMALRLTAPPVEHAQLAGMLHQAGLLHRRHLPVGAMPDALGVDAIGVCQHALEDWLLRQLGDLHCIVAHCALEFEHAEQAAPTDPQRIGALRFAWTCGQTYHWDIAEGMALLEQAAPKLAATVVSALERQWVFPVFTGETAYHQTVEYDWGGESDEKEFVNMNCRTKQERAAMRADIITKKDFVAAFPPWMLTWKVDKYVLDDAALRALAGNEGMAGQAAREVLHLRAVAGQSLMHRPKRDDDDAEFDGDFYGWGAVLILGASDRITLRVFDERTNCAMQGESTDVIASAWFAADEMDQLRDWQRALRPFLRAVVAVDRLLMLLTGPD